jgi:DNA ligase D-like protein (predicted ligase)/DNA ligase D-like protein (predicted polymerase)/DNA ligase D-like protein (predicted 3'-phosphoesterase)
MAKNSQLVEIDKHKIELTNLEKILYPQDGIIKAEVVQYYLSIAPTLLRHIKGRALSFIRYPDGINEESFFTKNKPNYAPQWIESAKLGKEKKDYIIATQQAVLVWTANLAALEIHQAQSRQPEFDKPDYFVIDLDPPDDYPFINIIEMALDVKLHLESFGYIPFVKTTGRKSVHIVVPLEQVYSYEDIDKATMEIGKSFTKKFPKTATLNIRKEARPDKVLIDIFRNRASQTIISPYSLRAFPKAPVSMPLTWEQLQNTTAITDYNIHNALDMVLENGDAWESIGAFSSELHTLRKKISASASIPQSLDKYKQKRSFEKTSEPQAESFAGKGNAFVFHRHHASRLHYDLRLEQNGVLKSWAVPRGLPPRPGIKRLAVNTEDHPLKYLDFHGSIPKGEYGGGEMWIYARGKYNITKTKKNGFYFRLQSKEVSAEFRIHDTGNNQWLLERVENPQTDYLQNFTVPMQAESAKKIPSGDNYIYEVKWDGIRTIITVDDGAIKIYSRNGKDITASFPELCIPEEAFRISTATFDGEIVCLDPAGRPVFKNVIKRMFQKNEGAAERASKKNPAVCYLFDCLYMDGRPLINEPLWQRQEWLADSIKPDTPYRFSNSAGDGKALFEAAKKHGLEGIMAKDINSKYYPGKRSAGWVKIKVRESIDCLIIGYTQGKGDRKNAFGALHLAEKNGNSLKYLGKVGTGWDDKKMKEIYEDLGKIEKSKKLISEKLVDDNVSTWLNPVLYCEVQYASVTSAGTLREPVFVRLRHDL